MRAERSSRRKRDPASRFRRAELARPWVLGHRGARHAAPENTLAAFELARREGADGVELDVRLDGSGVPVVIHDVDLTRVTRGERRERVDELPTEAFRAIDVGEGERVPRLSEVLAWARQHGARVNVEVKSDVREQWHLLRRVIAELRDEPDAGARIVLSSFHPVFVRVLSTALPEIPVCWLVHERQRVFRFAPGWRALGASGVNPEHTLLSGALVRRLRRAGGLVNVWTVNEPALAVAYARFGVDSIISDCPGRILEALPPSGIAKRVADAPPQTLKD